MPKIEEMFAFISYDKDDPTDEGLIAMKIGDNWFPLTGADMARVKSLRPLAKKAAQSTGKQVKLVKFTKRTELETIEP